MVETVEAEREKRGLHYRENDKKHFKWCQIFT